MTALSAKCVRIFFDRKFIVYTGIGVFVTLAGIAALTVAIDLMHVPTIIAATAVSAVQYVGRYLLFVAFKVVESE